MHKNNPRYKSWLKRRNLAKEKHRLKRKHKKFSYADNNSNGNSNPSGSRKSSSGKTQKFNAPSNFSLINNTEEVASYFEQVLKYTNQKNRITKNVFFDLGNITEVTADAIIYLLAVIGDLQTIGLAHKYFSGNLPTDPHAKTVFAQSGFLKYVRSDFQNPETFDKNIQILSDNKYNQNVTKRVCDFVCDHFNCTRTDTKLLYVLINEMMLNSYQHAYTDKRKQKNSWYLFVQSEGQKIKFTFLDSGLGIPNTVKKKLTDLFYVKSDADIVFSALDGEFRTQTKQKFRGKGLPKIKDCLKSHSFENMQIITNAAYCRIQYDHDRYITQKKDLNVPVLGTIFCWELNNISGGTVNDQLLHREGIY